jgi:hypothetical protein
MSLICKKIKTTMTNSIILIQLRSILLLSSIFFTLTTLKAQNYLTVPFNNGFVGVKNNNTSASNCYYHSGSGGVGWSNVQFAQNSSATIFTAQGNDIPGFAVITDYSNVEHTIPGFIKWRTNTGNTVECFVFEPTSSATLATNGLNGSNSYAITTNNYIGLTKNGTTISISPVPGTVSGNAAGVLADLNNYLAVFPKLNIGNASVVESTSSITIPVTLSVAPSSDVKVYFSLIDSTAVLSNDYLTPAIPATGFLTFLASEPTMLTKNITISIVDNSINEPTEYFKVVLSDPTNASIADGLAIITITDNDQALPVELTSFTSECKETGVDINWQTASEHNSELFTVEKSRDGLNWMHLASLEAAGNSTTLINYNYVDAEKSGVAYYRLQQVDQDGTEKTYGPISSSCEAISGLVMKTYPNPSSDLFTINIESEVPIPVAQIIVKDVFGRTVATKAVSIVAGATQVELLVADIENGIYSVTLEENGTAIKTVKQVIQ